VVLTVLNSFLRQSSSVSTNVTRALEVFLNDMQYINIRFTYLLTFCHDLLFRAAFCKNAATGSWYSFNDSRATEMREEEVVTRAAYLLFYQRRSAANDNSRSHDWLSQLQLSTNSSLPRTVTSHSLENIVDGDKGL